MLYADVYFQKRAHLLRVDFYLVSSRSLCVFEHAACPFLTDVECHAENIALTRRNASPIYGGL